MEYSDDSSYKFYTNDIKKLIIKDINSSKEIENIFNNKTSNNDNIIKTRPYPSTSCTSKNSSNYSYSTSNLKYTFTDDKFSHDEKLIDDDNLFSFENTKESISSASFFDEVDKINQNIFYKNLDEKEQEEPEITYISVNLLIKKIMTEKFMDSNKSLMRGFFQQCFLIIQTDILIHKTISCYNELSKNPNFDVQEFFSFLRAVVIENYNDIKNNEALIKILLDFFDENSTKESFIVNSDYDELKDLFQNNNSIFDEEFKFNSIKRVTSFKGSSLISAVFFTSPKDKNYFDIFRWSPEDVAKQLSFISYKLLSKLQPKELICKAKEENSKNMLSVVSRFDKLMLFIIEDIFSYDSEEVRGKAIEKWVKIALKCREYHNLNDCLIITSAFSHYLLRKMKKSWAKVSKRTLLEIEELQNFCDMSNGYFNLKKHINKCIETKEVYIPYIGMVVKEIVNINEKMKYIKDKFLISFVKIKTVANVLDRFFTFKRSIFKFRPLNQQTLIFEAIDPKTEEELEKMADMIEPRFILRNPDFKNKRRTKTDYKIFAKKF